MNKLYTINKLELSNIISNLKLEFDIENDIPKKYHDEILWNIKDSFGSKYAYNFSNYDILKKNILKCFSNIKKRINNEKNI
jgi:hypothetical protein